MQRRLVPFYFSHKVRLRSSSSRRNSDRISSQGSSRAWKITSTQSCRVSLLIQSFSFSFLLDHAHFRSSNSSNDATPPSFLCPTNPFAGSIEMSTMIIRPDRTNLYNLQGLFSPIERNFSCRIVSWPLNKILDTTARCLKWMRICRQVKLVKRRQGHVSSSTRIVSALLNLASLILLAVRCHFQAENRRTAAQRG